MSANGRRNTELFSRWAYGCTESGGACLIIPPMPPKMPFGAWNGHLKDMCSFVRFGPWTFTGPDPLVGRRSRADNLLDQRATAHSFSGFLSTGPTSNRATSPGESHALMNTNPVRASRHVRKNARHSLAPAHCLPPRWRTGEIGAGRVRGNAP